MRYRPLATILAHLLSGGLASPVIAQSVYPGSTSTSTAADEARSAPAAVGPLDAVLAIDPTGGNNNPAPPVAGPLDSVKQVPLFANWGLRKRLAAAGIALSARDVLEPAANTSGYKGTGLSVVNHLDIDAALDLGKLGVIDNGTVRIVLTDRLGNGINTTKTGGYIQDQAFYGQGKNVRFNEFSYEQTLLADKLSLKAGFYPMGNDFGKLPYTCNFTNNGNCGHPLGPIYSSGWRDDPTGQWGGRIKWIDHSGWYAEAGVYDVNTIRKTAGHGFDFDFNGTTGAFIPVEVGYVRGLTPSDYAGTYKVTFYYDTSRATRLGTSNGTTKGRSGVVVQAAQQIWKPSPETVRGIAVFGVWTIADRATGLLRESYEAGSSWRGVLAGRPNDILSASWTRVDVNTHLRDEEQRAGKDVQTNEEMWELNYGIQLIGSFLVRPGIQYVIRPGGYSSRPDTTVFTCHFQLTL